MTYIELAKALIDFNQNAEVAVNVGGERTVLQDIFFNNITVRDLLASLVKAGGGKVVINANGQALDITGIWSWSAYNGETYQPKRDIAKEKRLTPMVTLKTTYSTAYEDANEQDTEESLIAHKVRFAIADIMCWNMDLVQTDSKLGYDDSDEYSLEADSLDMVEIAMRLERDFQIDIPDNFNLENYKTVQDVIDLVSRILSGKQEEEQ